VHASTLRTPLGGALHGGGNDGRRAAARTHVLLDALPLRHTRRTVPHALRNRLLQTDAERVVRAAAAVPFTQQQHVLAVVAVAHPALNGLQHLGLRIRRVVALRLLCNAVHAERDALL
jgi:hypothetical protein